MGESGRWLALGGGFEVLTDAHHRVGADAFLLADFARPAGIGRALEIGSGCGIIPFLWHRWGRAPALVAAVELQPQAVRLLQAGIDKNGLSARVQAIQADIVQLAAASPPEQWQLVCCNPPYFAAGSGKPSRHPADRLCRHEDSLTPEAMCCAAGRLLQFGGRFCFCHRPERLAELFGALQRARLEPKRLRLVQQNGQSAPWLALIEAKKGGRPGLCVLPPFLQQQMDGRPTAEAARLFGEGEEDAL